VAKTPLRRTPPRRTGPGRAPGRPAPAKLRTVVPPSRRPVASRTLHVARHWSRGGRSRHSVIIKVSGGGATSTGSSAIPRPTSNGGPAHDDSRKCLRHGRRQLLGGQVSAPITLKNQPALTGTPPAERSFPRSCTSRRVLPVLRGAALVDHHRAQSIRTWSGLGNMTSAAKDSYRIRPRSPLSGCLQVKVPDLQERRGVHQSNRCAGNNYVSLQNPTAAEQKLILKYDTAKYIPGLTSASATPFLYDLRQQVPRIWCELLTRHIDRAHAKRHRDGVE